MRISIYMIVVFVFILSASLQAQTNYFDPATTQILVDRNKKNFEDNQKGENNQVAETVGMAELKNTEDQCKEVFDRLDEKLNQAFIVIADVYTADQIAESLQRTYRYQTDMLGWVYKKPWLAALYYPNETRIIQQAQNLITLIVLCVVTYGQLSKMTVANRKIVYTQIMYEMQHIEADSMALDYLCKMAATGEDLKGLKILTPYFNDKQVVTHIMKQWKDR